MTTKPPENVRSAKEPSMTPLSILGKIFLIMKLIDLSNKLRKPTYAWPWEVA
jgi:hypothetical protein